KGGWYTPSGNTTDPIALSKRRMHGLSDVIVGVSNGTDSTAHPKRQIAMAIVGKIRAFKHVDKPTVSPVILRIGQQLRFSLTLAKSSADGQVFISQSCASVL